MEMQYGAEDEVAARQEIMGRDDGIDMEKDHVVIERDGIIPSIAFSQKVHEQLIKPWQATVLVKLLGRMIDYEALVSRLDALWPNIGGFSVIIKKAT